MTLLCLVAGRASAHEPTVGEQPANSDAPVPSPRPDFDRDLNCLTQAIYYEAGAEPIDGQRAVAQVVLNRVRRPSFPKSVCGVVYDGAWRSTGCQFTFTCDGSLSRPPSRWRWDKARAVAADALEGRIDDATGGATHYHASWMTPYWSGSMVMTAHIGGHVFYTTPRPAAPLPTSAKSDVGGIATSTRAMRSETRARHAAKVPLAPPPPAPSTFSVWGLQVATVTPAEMKLAGSGDR